MELQLFHEPVIRTKMYHQGNGVYESTFVAPDVRGVYTWQLKFRERGYNFLDGEEYYEATQEDLGCKTKLVKPIGPKRYEEEQRFFLVGAPYYVACSVILAATVLLLLRGE
jgi:hypothetical protein